MIEIFYVLPLLIGLLLMVLYQYVNKNVTVETALMTMACFIPLVNFLLLFWRS